MGIPVYLLLPEHPHQEIEVALHLPHHEQRQAGLLHKDEDIGVNYLRHPFGHRLVPAGHNVINLGNERQDNPGQHGTEHLVLRPEIIMQGRTVDAYTEGNVAHARAVKSLFQEQLLGTRQYTFFHRLHRLISSSCW